MDEKIIENSTQHLTWLGEYINKIATEDLRPLLGDLSGEILGGIVVALLVLSPQFIRFIVKTWKNFKKANIYILMPSETEYNLEHLAHQINGFQIFLNQEANKNLHVKFVMVKQEDEIHEFINKIQEKKIVLLTTMSFVFNETLKQLVVKTGKINSNIRVVGTLGSESKAFNNIHQPSRVIRVFPPDYDEAKIAYDFFYHKLLSYFCSNEHCKYSHTLGKQHRASMTLYHSESYGTALSKQFRTYFDENSMNDEINPFGQQDASRFKDLRIYDFQDENLTLDEEASFHFIFLVGYEPNISKMLKMVFNEIRSKAIDVEKVCFLFSPTVGVTEWKTEICKTIDEANDLQINKDQLFYLKSKIPAETFEFKKPYINTMNQVETIELDFYDYNLKHLHLSQELESKIKVLNSKPNYINTFAYIALRVAKRIRQKWHTDLPLHTIKYDAFREVLGSNKRPIIYYNGDSVEHFTIRPFKM